MIWLTITSNQNHTTQTFFGSSFDLNVPKKYGCFSWRLCVLALTSFKEAL
jgi:hypothetical protein